MPDSRAKTYRKSKRNDRNNSSTRRIAYSKKLFLKKKKKILHVKNEATPAISPTNEAPKR